MSDTFTVWPAPTQTGFNDWVQNVMGVSTEYLPTTSSALVYAFVVAQATVNPQIQQASYPGAQILYTQAVYNLGGDNLVNWAPDQPGVYAPSPPAPANTGYFAWLRQQYKIFDFTAGVVSASSDEGSSVSLDVVEGLKNLTVGQLGNLKTPWGRRYLSIAQSVGSLWGLS